MRWGCERQVGSLRARSRCHAISKEPQREHKCQCAGHANSIPVSGNNARECASTRIECWACTGGHIYARFNPIRVRGHMGTSQRQAVCEQSSRVSAWVPQGMYTGHINAGRSNTGTWAHGAHHHCA
jgi:hypothetical protein